MSMLSRVFISCVLLFSTIAPLHAQELHQDVQEVVRGTITAIVNEERQRVAGGETYTLVQTVRVELLEGSNVGETIEVQNDLVELSVGEKVYLNHIVYIDGGELYAVKSVDRASGIYLLLALFAGAVVLFGGRQGARSLASLAGSFLLIVYVLFPLFLAGYPPLLVGGIVGSIVLAFAIVATHGASLESLIAWSGATIAICVTVLVAMFGVDLLHLTGFFSDETVYLNLNTRGMLDMQGLLLSGIIIGVLGVLDDIAVTQVAVVGELKRAAAHLSKRELYEKALRVGREHVSALVNTIALAYAGVSLPLLLLFSQSDATLAQIMSNEIFATELVRTIAGSIGLIATVPITTALAAFFADKLTKGSHHGHHHA